MIYEFLRERLDTVPQLAGAVYPTTVCVDDIEGAFAIYTYKGRRPVKDLSGEVHHYEEEILLDILGQDYELLHELYCAAEDALSVSNWDTEKGEYIFSVSCSSPEPDGFNLNTSLLRRAMLVTIYWCPV